MNMRLRDDLKRLIAARGRVYFVALPENGSQQANDAFLIINKKYA